MGVSIDGLASNLDTTKIIDALMDVERLPRTLLSAKADDRRVVITQLQSLNTSLQALMTRAKDAAGPASLAQVTASSSHASVGVVARAGATAMTAQLIVDRAATSHTVVTSAVTAFPDDPLVLTIENDEGALIEVRPATGSPADVARALTAAGAGVIATSVSAGTAPDGTAQHRLQLTAAETGASGRFRVHLGDAAAVAAGTATDLAAQPGAAVVTPGADAQVRLWAGTAAEQTVTSSSNTFTDLFPGVDVTVTAASADRVTLTLGANTAERISSAKSFVSQVAALVAGIAKGSTATAATAPGSNTTLGVFTGDSTVRALRQAVTDAVQHPVDGVSPSTIGISFDRYGVLSFDEEKFRTAVEADPAQVQEIFSGLATRVADVADEYSDKYDGLLTARITGQQDEVRTISQQLERWDVRLDQRRATLERTYAAMETMLSRLQAQSSYLTSQIAGLPSYSRSDS